MSIDTLTEQPEAQAGAFYQSLTLLQAAGINHIMAEDFLRSLEAVEGGGDFLEGLLKLGRLGFQEVGSVGRLVTEAGTNKARQLRFTLAKTSPLYAYLNTIAQTEQRALMQKLIRACNFPQLQVYGVEAVNNTPVAAQAEAVQKEVETITDLEPRALADRLIHDEELKYSMTKILQLIADSDGRESEHEVAPGCTLWLIRPQARLICSKGAPFPQALRLDVAAIGTHQDAFQRFRMEHGFTSFEVREIASVDNLIACRRLGQLSD